MSALEWVLLAVAVVLFFMYLHSKSVLKTTKKESSQAIEKANRETKEALELITKSQYEETAKFYDELLNLMHINASAYYDDVEKFVNYMPRNFESYYKDVKEWGTKQRTVKFDSNGVETAIRFTTSIVKGYGILIEDLGRKVSDLQKQLENKKILIELLEVKESNLKAIPYMAKIVADYETYPLEETARKLDWGSSLERMKKVASIREIRRASKEMIEKYKYSEYQLAYLIELFPGLSDVIDAEFNTLPAITIDDLSEHDRTKDYLSKEEYLKLSTTERNQLALDRYIESHNKSKWQIGRDYELYIGYTYYKKGYEVEYFGEFNGLEDLGRDLICKKNDKTFIVQCKYWSQGKLIHENSITQLYGTTVSYCIENDIPKSKVKGILITNIQLSDMAKKMADYLKIQYKENVPMDNYPRIKCNIGVDEFGYPTKIYHLPFDQQYDSTKIDKDGEIFALTVKEAETAGFRRAFKWFGK